MNKDYEYYHIGLIEYKVEAGDEFYDNDNRKWRDVVLMTDSSPIAGYLYRRIKLN